jgi:hypothetical protein
MELIYVGGIALGAGATALAVIAVRSYREQRRRLREAKRIAQAHFDADTSAIAEYHRAYEADSKHYAIGRGGHPVRDYAAIFKEQEGLPGRTPFNPELGTPIISLDLSPLEVVALQSVPDNSTPTFGGGDSGGAGASDSWSDSGSCDSSSSSDSGSCGGDS